MLRASALLLTVFTGFTGLVYEVTWQKYLATLLGSHSEATAAVLGIFLGGLSVGYSLFGRVTRRVVENAEAAGRPPRLLLVYGVVEAAIGVWALLFPTLFGAVQAFSFLVPIESAGLAFGFDVLLATLLIGPPTVLMGGTIPILTQALARSLDDATRFHAFVYAFNTAGAFAGALAAGFFLIPALGLVRILVAMGAINIVAGGVFVLLGLRPRATFDAGSEAPGTRIGGFALYACVALLVGFAMMSIQTVLIRVAGLSFGASQFTFSTVVAVFVLCIALGSFAVSALPRIGPGLVVGSHWLLALLAGLLYLRLQEGPYWAHALRSLFRDEAAGFYPYYLSGFVLLLLVMGLPVMLSGASLPLLFHQLRRETDELGAVAGRLYSWNTVGSLLGALLGGYALLFWLDLHHLYRIAVAALALAAVLLTARLLPLPATLSLPWLRAAVAGALAAPLLIGLALLPPWLPQMLSSGIFRQRQPVPVSWAGPDAFRDRVALALDFPFHDDDPTTTVVVRETKEGGRLARSIVTNGKSDGSTAADYTTMALAGILPALLADHAERSFVIGYGTGVSAGELAAIPEMREVLVAEISPGVIEAAPYFDFANLGASVNPKVRIVRSDAYRALLRSHGAFDVIVSEPSNPWVTGVEMLFSREFLEVARGRLAPGGVYAQWFHQYETSDETIAMVLRTYAAVFDRVAVWYAQGPDLLLLGFQDDRASLDLARLEARVRQPHYVQALRRSKIRGLPELLAHELMPLGVVNAAKLEGPIHTLLHPRLNHEAGRAFFRGALGTLPFTGVAEAAELGADGSLVRRFAERHRADLPPDFRARVVAEACRQRSWQCATLLARWVRDDPDDEALQQQSARLQKRPPMLGAPFAQGTPEQLSFLFDADAIPADNRYTPDLAQKVTHAFQTFYHHGAPFSPEALLAYWERCKGNAEEAARCGQGLARAHALLDGTGDAAEPEPDLLPEPGLGRSALLAD